MLSFVSLDAKVHFEFSRLAKFHFAMNYPASGVHVASLFNCLRSELFQLLLLFCEAPLASSFGGIQPVIPVESGITLTHCFSTPTILFPFYLDLPGSYPSSFLCISDSGSPDSLPQPPDLLVPIPVRDDELAYKVFVGIYYLLIVSRCSL